MGTTDYVSYELAVKLKECGFDEPCRYFYSHKDEPDDCVSVGGDARFAEDYNVGQTVGSPIAVSMCSMPSLYAVQKWLREKKELCATVHAQPYNGLPYYTGYILFDGDENEVLGQDGHWFDDYEKCLLETIAAALELIKKGE